MKRYLRSEGGCHENNLAQKTDVVAQTVQPRVDVAHRNVGRDAGKQVVHLSVRQDVLASSEVAWAPRIDREPELFD